MGGGRRGGPASLATNHPPALKCFSRPVAAAAAAGAVLSYCLIENGGVVGKKFFFSSDTVCNGHIHNIYINIFCFPRLIHGRISL